jgi:hypothetical protein
VLLRQPQIFLLRRASQPRPARPETNIGSAADAIACRTISATKLSIEFGLLAHRWQRLPVVAAKFSEFELS